MTTSSPKIPVDTISIFGGVLCIRHNPGNGIDPYQFVNSLHEWYFDHKELGDLYHSLAACDDEETRRGHITVTPVGDAREVSKDSAPESFMIGKGEIAPGLKVLHELVFGQ